MSSSAAGVAGIAPLAALLWARAVLSARRSLEQARASEQKSRALRQQLLQWERENEEDRLNSLADARPSSDRPL
jgi:hypothetical protein